MLSDAVQVFVAIEHVDFRSSLYPPAGFARDRIGIEAGESALVDFFGRRRDAL